MHPNDKWLWIAAIVFVAGLLVIAWEVMGWITG